MKIDKAIEVLEEHKEDFDSKSEIYQALNVAVNVIAFFNDVITHFGKKGGEQ